jgi:predicted transcriptional regulator
MTDEFIREFNSLHKWIADFLNIREHQPFTKLIQMAAERSHVVARNEKFLRSMANLRNAIVHDPEHGKRIIAIPEEAVVRDFIKICNEIKKPPTVWNKASQNPKIFSSDDLLVEALMTMRENNFSQVVVAGFNHEYGLVTREGITRWLEANVDDDVVSLKETYLRDIIVHEDDSTWHFVGKHTSIYDVVKLFVDDQRRLQAILITESGVKSQRPLGLLTFEDISKFLISATDTKF